MNKPKAKPTPGPWIVKRPRIGAAITIYGADGEFPVATTCSNTSPATMQAHRDGTVAANANVIAAAWEMREALRKCKTAALPAEVLDLVNAALAKADA